MAARLPSWISGETDGSGFLFVPYLRIALSLTVLPQFALGQTDKQTTDRHPNDSNMRPLLRTVA